VLVRRIPQFPDERGAFNEIWRSSWFQGLPSGAAGSMRQANLSRSVPRVLRGFHLHRRQADFWVVAEGTAFVAMVDVRPELESAGPAVLHTIDAPPGTAIYLPEGVAHGFYARDGLTLIYLVTNEYDGTDELGFAYDDPQIAAPWPDPDPVVSQRDRDAGTLGNLVARLRIEGLGDD
jgi:dTDP-4-dehydrorhamnose 3,5-epimerase